MPVTLTCSTWNFIAAGGEYASAARVLEEIRSLGLLPELWLNWDPQPDCYDRPYWQDLRKLVGPSPAVSFHTRNDRQRMLEEIELLAFLGGRTLVVHPVVLSLPEFRQERPSGHPDLPFIRELAAAARERGVLLALENIHARAFLDRTLEGVDTFDERGGLGICIDIGHAEMASAGSADSPPARPSESAVSLIRDYGPVLLHLHVHDVRDGRDHQPLGTGWIDYAAVAAALREVNFHGTAALEIQSEDPPATARESLEYLGPYFGADLRTRR
jgi:sugar phosphate isomerase/epimerase